MKKHQPPIDASFQVVPSDTKTSRPSETAGVPAVIPSGFGAKIRSLLKRDGSKVPPTADRSQGDQVVAAAPDDEEAPAEAVPAPPYHEGLKLLADELTTAITSGLPKVLTRNGFHIADFGQVLTAMREGTLAFNIFSEICQETGLSPKTLERLEYPEADFLHLLHEHIEDRILLKDILKVKLYNRLRELSFKRLRTITSSFLHNEQASVSVGSEIARWARNKASKDAGVDDVYIDGLGDPGFSEFTAAMNLQAINGTDSFDISGRLFTTWGSPFKEEATGRQLSINKYVYREGAFGRLCLKSSSTFGDYTNQRVRKILKETLGKGFDVIGEEDYSVRNDPLTFSFVIKNALGKNVAVVVDVGREGCFYLAEKTDLYPTDPLFQEEGATRQYNTYPWTLKKVLNVDDIVDLLGEKFSKKGVVGLRTAITADEVHATLESGGESTALVSARGAVPRRRSPR